MYKCDICSKEIAREEMQVVPGSKVVEMSKKGFVPSQIALPQMWQISVNQNPTADWGFCQNYFSEFKAFEPEEQVTSLIGAAGKGHMEIVRQLLDAGADVHAADNEGCTALDFAKRQGKKDIVKMLKQKGVKTKSFFSFLR